MIDLRKVNSIKQNINKSVFHLRSPVYLLHATASISPPKHQASNFFKTQHTRCLTLHGTRQDSLSLLKSLNLLSLGLLTNIEVLDEEVALGV